MPGKWKGEYQEISMAEAILLFWEYINSCYLTCHYYSWVVVIGIPKRYGKKHRWEKPTWNHFYFANMWCHCICINFDQVENKWRILLAVLLHFFSLELLSNFLPFVQIKNMKNTHVGVLILVKLQAETFFKLYKWYQIVQRVTFVICFGLEGLH